MEKLNQTEIIKLIYKYYPKDLYVDDPRYSNSPEFIELIKKREFAKNNMDKWQILLDEIRKALPDVKIYNSTLLDYDACYKCRFNFNVYNYENDKLNNLVILISIISPFYFIYFSSQDVKTPGHPLISYEIPDQYNEYKTVLESKISKLFPEYKPLPMTIADEFVPDLAVGNNQPGESKVINCLFTEDIS